ncbi:hypothetical protein J31TS3_03610 [Paenibacillus lactis]|nr:hypothetical protein J31TS3_03610 [Paenibacillus lactis]
MYPFNLSYSQNWRNKAKRPKQRKNSLACMKQGAKERRGLEAKGRRETYAPKGAPYPQQAADVRDKQR